MVYHDTATRPRHVEPISSAKVQVRAMAFRTVPLVLCGAERLGETHGEELLEKGLQM